MMDSDSTRVRKDLTIEEIVDLLQRGNGSFSWQGALALARHLRQLEAGSGEAMELDPYEIARSWTEYDTAREALEDIDIDRHDDIEDRLTGDLNGDSWQPFNEHLEERCLEWLERVYSTVTFFGGVLVKRSSRLD